MSRRNRLLAALALAVTTGVAAAQPAPLNGITLAPHPLPNYAPVTDQVLRAPDAADWLMVRGNYQGWGYSSLDQINKATVKGLQLVWSRTMNGGINEAGP